MTNQRIELLRILGAKCSAEGCDITDSDMLQVDHINNDGFMERRKYGSQAGVYAFYLKNPAMARLNLQALCANHNWKKRALVKAAEVDFEREVAERTLLLDIGGTRFDQELKTEELDALSEASLEALRRRMVMWYTWAQDELERRKRKGGEGK